MTESLPKSKIQVFFSQLLAKITPSTRKSIVLTLLATGLTLTLFIVIAFLEPIKNDQGKPQCQNGFFWDYFTCKISNSKLLGQVQNFSVIIAAILYVLERSERKKQAELQAWRLIDAAKGIETSGARFQALQELNEERVFLRGLDADGADLIKINLPRAYLEKASLQGVFLQGANLQGARLQQAQLQKADLRGANLKKANLWAANLEKAKLQEREPDTEDGKVELLEERITKLQEAKLGKAILREATLNNANLSGAILCGANLSRADLRKVNLQGADLSEAILCGANLQGANLSEVILCGANLQGANLQGANLQGADLNEAILRGANLQGVGLPGAKLSGTKFRKTLHLTLEQVQLADDWEKAKYDEVFSLKYPELNLLQDEPDNIVEERELEKNREELAEIKLIGIFKQLIQKKNKIAEILQNIADLIILIDSGNSTYLQDSPLVKDLMDAWKSLIAEEESLGNVAQAAEMRGLIEDLRDDVDQEDKASKNLDKVEDEMRNAEPDKEPYLRAGRWLKSNREIVKSEAIRSYLDKKRQAKQTGGILDSDEKIRQLAVDIDNCLEQLCDCIVNLEEPDYGKIELNLPIPIQSEVFEVILEQVIPEVLKKQPDKLPNEVVKILKDFVDSSIKKLQQKSGCGMNEDV